MISRELLPKLIRYYFATYRLEHDIDWVKPDSSFWCFNFAVQPGLLSQLSLLREVFKGGILDVDDSTGNIVYKSEMGNIAEPPVLDGFISGMEKIASDLAGTRFQIQILISHKDSELEEDFTRDEKWQWLVSSPRLCELFVVGNINEKGLIFENVYHSCHQADHNRDISEDSRLMVDEWEKCFREVAVYYGFKDEAIDEELEKAEKLEIKGPADKECVYQCDSSDAAASIADTCRKLGVFESRKIGIKGHTLTSRLNIAELTDLVCGTRDTLAMHLFGSDVLPD